VVQGFLKVVMARVVVALVVLEALRLQILGLQLTAALAFHHLYLALRFNTLAVVAVVFHQIT
jgi:hypothetical protein